jgi:hypothetical protein
MARPATAKVWEIHLLFDLCIDNLASDDYGAGPTPEVTLLALSG